MNKSKLLTALANACVYAWIMIIICVFLVIQCLNHPEANISLETISSLLWNPLQVFVLSLVVDFIFDWLRSDR